MAKAVTIQVRSDFRLAEEELPFFNACIEWAQKLNNALGSGVSVFFFRNNKYPEWSPFAEASFAWRGESIACMAWRSDLRSIQGRVFLHDRSGRMSSPLVKNEEVWKRVFKPSLESIVGKGVEEFQSLGDKISKVFWTGVSKEADD